MDGVWVFLGERAIHPAAVFSSREKAEVWIAAHGLDGILTLYPVDEPIYEWAIARGIFRPKQPYQFEAKFIQRFSSASQDYYHYELGKNLTGES